MTFNSRPKEQGYKDQRLNKINVRIANLEQVLGSNSIRYPISSGSKLGFFPHQ